MRAAFPHSGMTETKWERGIHCFTTQYKTVSADSIREIYQKRMEPKGLTYSHHNKSFVCGDFGVVFHAVVREEQLEHDSEHPYAIAEAWTNTHVLNLIITGDTKKRAVMVFEPQTGRFEPLANYQTKINFVKF